MQHLVSSIYLGFRVGRGAGGGGTQVIQRHAQVVRDIVRGISGTWTALDTNGFTGRTRSARRQEEATSPKAILALRCCCH